MRVGVGVRVGVRVWVRVRVRVRVSASHQDRVDDPRVAVEEGLLEG